MEEKRDRLNLDGLPLKVDIKDIDLLSNDEYIMARRNGFGASDSSVLVGVNPYQTKFDLIKSKLQQSVTAEERKVGTLSAVRKGRDLEPLMINKLTAFFGKEVMKPVDMYRFKDLPFLTINYDGVLEEGEGYVPAEIKIVTKAGERHYDFGKAFFRESNALYREDDDDEEWLKGVSPKLTIEQRAAYYGVPPYYYTQLMQEMFGLNAQYGYLATLRETAWELCIFKIPFDKDAMDRIIIEGMKMWQHIEDVKKADTL